MANELTWSEPNKHGISYAKGAGHILESFLIERRRRRDRVKDSLLYPFALRVKTHHGTYYKRVGVFKTREDAEREARTMERHQIVSRSC